jgi:hypothetical protein
LRHDGLLKLLALLPLFGNHECRRHVGRLLCGSFASLLLCFPCTPFFFHRYGVLYQYAPANHLPVLQNTGDV